MYETAEHRLNSCSFKLHVASLSSCMPGAHASEGFEVLGPPIAPHLLYLILPEQATIPNHSPSTGVIRDPNVSL